MRGECCGEQYYTNSVKYVKNNNQNYANCYLTIKRDFCRVGAHAKKITDESAMNLETDIVVSECPCVDLRVEVRLEFGLELRHSSRGTMVCTFLGKTRQILRELCLIAPSGCRGEFTQSLIDKCASHSTVKVERKKSC